MEGNKNGIEEELVLRIKLKAVESCIRSFVVKSDDRTDGLMRRESNDGCGDVFSLREESV